MWASGPEHCECLCACGPRDLSQSANPTPPTRFSSLWPSSVVPGDRGKVVLSERDALTCPDSGEERPSGWCSFTDDSPISFLPFLANLPSLKPFPAFPLLFGPRVRLEVSKREAAGSQGLCQPHTPDATPVTQFWWSCPCTAPPPQGHTPHRCSEQSAPPGSHLDVASPLSSGRGDAIHSCPLPIHLCP